MAIIQIVIKSLITPKAWEMVIFQTVIQSLITSWAWKKVIYQIVIHPIMQATIQMSLIYHTMRLLGIIIQSFIHHANITLNEVII